MDQQIEFRALLLRILNELSYDARCSFLFVLGDTIPRIQRDNTTFLGTLTAMESLFERAKISLDDCQYLIDAFEKIQCYKAADRLQEYQNSQRSVTTVQYKFADICSDNIEYDGKAVHPSDTTGKSKPMLSVDRSEISRNRTPTLIIKSATIINQKQIRKNCFQTLFFKLILLFIIQILLSIACISIFYIYYHFSYNTNDVYALISSEDSPPQQNETWFHHSTNLSLTYTDHLSSIEAYPNHWNRSISVTFIYSSTKQFTHQLAYSINNAFNQFLSINFTNDKPYKIHQYYRNTTDSSQIVGLNITLGENSYIIGQYDKLMYSSIAPAKYNLGFVSTKLTNLNSIEKFRFVWYRKCSTKIHVINCLPFKEI